MLIEFTNINNFYEQFIDISDTPKNSKLATLKFMFKKPYLSQYLMVSNKQCSKFKLDCLESKNSFSIPSYA